MGSMKVMALAGAAILSTVVGAAAADLPPLVQRPLPVVEDVGFASGWYLRGDVGIGVQDYRSFDFTQTNLAFVWPASWRIDNKEQKDTAFVGVGLGFQLNPWLRFDVTGEYRIKSIIHAVGSYTEFCPGGLRCFDVYDGNHSASVFMANAYIDFGTWGRITPFVGVGVGGAYHRVTNFWDLGLIADGSIGRGFAEDHSDWQFAWAVHAGLSYDVMPGLKLELAYRYLNMGDVRTGIVDCMGCGVTGGPLAYYTLRNFDSHDFKVGMRWLIQDMPRPMYAEPIMRKG
jgi:opacity protein-like surface antigen